MATESVEKEPHTLIVLAHGLVGGPGDLKYLQETIERISPYEHIVLNANSNRGQTREGVAKGAHRIADETRAEVKRWPSLRRISFVGNSLGGLYVRYALRLLWDGETATIAGLVPETFMTTATPHLGVRRFMWGISYPEASHFIASLLFAQTGRDIFLRDNLAGGSRKPKAAEGATKAHGETAQCEQEDWEWQPGRANPLLFRMATERGFLEPLAAFKRRRAYANLRGDMMVQRQTAALLLEPVQYKFSEPHAPSWLESLFGRRRGLIVRVPPQLPPTSAAQEQAPTAATAGEADAAAAEKEREASAAAAAAAGAEAAAAAEKEREAAAAATQVPWLDPGYIEQPQPRSGMAMEVLMAGCLNRLEWSKVLVDFAGLFPLNHNAIVAHSATKLSERLNRCGRVVMDQAAGYLTHDFSAGPLEEAEDAVATFDGESVLVFAPTEAAIAAEAATAAAAAGDGTKGAPEAGIGRQEETSNGRLDDTGVAVAT